MKASVFAACFVALAAVAGAVSAQRSAAPTMEVYKSPTCGCCAKWVEHVRAAGISVKVEDLADADLDRLKANHGVPRTAQSCHTALVGGYVVEGHVPVADVQRLLKERPAVTGLAVAGMPIGSPGMEMPGVRAQTYNVLTFDKQGAVRVFSTQNP